MIFLGKVFAHEADAIILRLDEAVWCDTRDRCEVMD